MRLVEVREYLDENDNSPFGKWFAKLNAQAAAKVTVAIARMEQDNLSNVKGVGQSVLEYRINFGPGYRLYFGKDGETLILLLAGGTKGGQPNDIKVAHQRWTNYKKRKKEG